MTGPISNPPPDPGPGGPIVGGAAPEGVSPDVVALEAELATPDGGRLARYTARARTVVRVLAVVVGATALVALAVGLAAWRDHPVGLVVVVVLCLPGIVGPIRVDRRAGALARAAAHPRELAHQVEDLVRRVRHSAELQELAEALSRRGSRPARGLIGRARGAIRLVKLASAVLGLAQPDAERHPLVVPFTPDQLATTWSSLWMSLWGWALAALVLVVSTPALVASLL